MNNFKIFTNLLPQKHYFLLLKILILSSVLSLMDYLLLVIQRSIQCHLLPEALASSCFNSIHLCGSVVKNLPAMRETQIWSLGQEDHDPLRRKWQPTAVFLPGKSHGQRSLAGKGAHGITKSWTWLTLSHFHKCICAMPCCLWDPNFPNRNWTQARSSGSMESKPLDHQQIP